jgi:hypothetical protein
MQTRFNQSTREEFPEQNPDSASWSYAAANLGIVNTTTAVTIKAAPTAQSAPYGGTAVALRNYLTSLDVTSDTLGAATELAIRDGAGGTVLWRIKLPTTAMQARQFVFPSPLKGTAGNLLEVVTLTASVTGGVWVNAQGYVGL